MCIFFSASGLVVGGRAPRVSVANTNLFARLTGPASQLLVYQMSIASPADTAMVLPLPVAEAARADAVRFIDFSAYAGFFKGLSRLAYFDDGVYEGLSLSNLPNTLAPTRPPIPVQEVGAYEASYLPSVADFDRLDRRFEVPVGLWDAYPQYADYGFAVFRLKPTTGKALKGVHPMALEFETRLEHRLFAPTVHVHDGAVHRFAYFDHLVYVQGATIREPSFLLLRDGLPVQPGEKTGGSRHTGTVRFSAPGWNVGPQFAAQYETPEGAEKPSGPSLVTEWIPYLDPRENLHVVEMKGMLGNTDTFFSVRPVQTRPLAARA